MAADLLQFPESRRDPVPSWLPRSELRRLKQIDHWRENAQQTLAALPGQSVEHHQALRRIADELKAQVVAQFAPPRP